MKLKLIISAALLGLSGLSYAQQAVKVSGQLNFARKAVKLFEVKEGKTTEIASAVPQNNKFGFLFHPQYEGLYVIGTGNENNASENYPFYFKGGEQLDITLEAKTYALNGTQNSKENVILKQWRELTDPLYQKAINFAGQNSTFVDYFPEQEAIVAKSKTFLAGKNSGNPKFDKAIKDIMEMDLISYATNFINTPRSAHPSLEEYSDFYGTIKAQNITKNTGKIYNYPWGQRALTSLIMINMRQDNKTFKPGEEGLNMRLAYVLNDTLKANIVLDNLAGFKNYGDYKVMADKYSHLFLTKSQKDRNNAIMSPLLTYKAGSDSYAFNYPDKDEKMVSLASLKGKVVLVDVWATWCGPCKVEIPHLKKLEEEMKGKEVAIISLSTDAVKDKDKWLKMIKDDNLTGIQLFAGGPSNEFSQYYKINAIPRFLVFDKQGKIVTVDSPRPSNPALKELLEKELAK